VLERQHLIGYWPATCLAALTEHIDGGGRSLQGWLELAAARLVVEPFPIVNVNRPEDLRDL
jgi:molybdopterin-guanine dinucleotide biosynthesis protein A